MNDRDDRIGPPTMLAAARESKRLTQKQLGAKVGCSHSTIAGHEARHYDISPELKAKCLVALGIPRSHVRRVWPEFEGDLPEVTLPPDSSTTPAAAPRKKAGRKKTGARKKASRSYKVRDQQPAPAPAAPADAPPESASADAPLRVWHIEHDPDALRAAAGDSLIGAVLAKMPDPEGPDWPQAERKVWLRTLEAAFDLTFGLDDEEA